MVKSPDDLLPAALQIAESLVYNSAALVTSLKNTIDVGRRLSYGEARKFELKQEAQYYKALDSKDLAEILIEGAQGFDQRVAELRSCVTLSFLEIVFIQVILGGERSNRELHYDQYTENRRRLAFSICSLFI